MAISITSVLRPAAGRRLGLAFDGRDPYTLCHRVGFPLARRVSVTYRMLALDCDGVIAGPDNVVPREIAEAVGAAERAGLRICLATGRSFVETMPLWRQVRLAGPTFEPLVTLGGALVSDVPAGRTLFHQPIPRHLATDLARAMAEAGYCAMAIVDVWRHGVDYVVTLAGNIADVDARWFAQMDVTVRRVRNFDNGADLPEALRISAVVDPADAPELERILQDRFDGALDLHAILAPNYGVTIVEAFAAGANKFTGVRYVAQSSRIPASQIVAVGDDVNDIPLLTGAGLGVAMPHAPDSVKAAADTVATDGLAAFVHSLTP